MGAGHERLDQHTGHGQPEDQQQRRELPVFDMWRREAGRRSGASEERHGVVPFSRSKETAVPRLGRPLTRAVTAAGCGGTGSVAWTCTSVWWTAGLMMFSSGCGTNPKTMISAISGPIAHSSLGFRSVIFSVSGRTGPVIVRWYSHRM